MSQRYTTIITTRSNAARCLEIRQAGLVERTIKLLLFAVNDYLLTLMQRAICFCNLASAKLPPALYALHESAVLCTRKGAASLAWLATVACAGLLLAKEAMVTHGDSCTVPMGVDPHNYTAVSFTQSPNRGIVP